MRFREKIRKNDIVFAFSLAAIFILSALFYQELFYKRNKPERIRNEFFRVLNEKEKFVRSTLEKLALENSKHPDSSGRNFSPRVTDQFDKNGIIIFIAEKDSLIYWSQNSAELPKKFLEQADTANQFTRLSNGWYEVMQRRIRGMTYLGLILIKSEYPFENEFLKNEFQRDFEVPYGTLIKLIKVNSRDNLVLDIPSNIRPSVSHQFTLFLFWLCSLVFLITGIYRVYLRFRHIFPSVYLFLGSLIFDILILRIIFFYFRIPVDLYDTELFGPVRFSSSFYLPSLGDFFVNGLLLLTGAYIIYLNLKPPEKSNSPLLLRLFYTILIVIIITTGFVISIYLIRSLLLNSTIPFDLQNIAGLSVYSILGFFIIAQLFLSWFLVTVRLLNFLPVLLHQDSGIIKQVFTTGTLTTKKIVFNLVFFSLIITIVLDQTNSTVENEKRKFLAVKTGMQHDPLAEMMFADIEAGLLNDSILFRLMGRNTLLSSELEDSADNYLLQHYFPDNWHNYLVQITVCSPEKKLSIQPQNYDVNCGSYFRNILKETGKKTGSKHLFFLDLGYGSKNYLAVIPLLSPRGPNDSSLTAYIEIGSKLVFRDLGYPELLVDTRQNKITDIGDYSYAFYRDNKLIYRFGKYQYNLNLGPKILQRGSKDQFFKSDGMDHYFHRVDNKNILILSKKENSLLDRASPFSYLFFFFSVFVILFYMVVRFPVIFRFNAIRLETRVQGAMITLLTGSLLITGFLILYYIVRLNADKNTDNLNERSHSVLVELQHRFGSEDMLGANKPENLNELLTKYSNVFFTDVNLYHPDGRILATSRPQVFEQGLISSLMNSRAWYLLKFRHSSIVIQKESIGSDQYYSAYIPFFNDRNELLAYLNLPYFAKQEDLSREISTFLIAFINIYILIIIAGIFIALVVSTYISRPVRLLTSGLGTLALGKSNEKLKWRRRDEIGKLVEEYNRLVDELALSAELLARSERESAWREMARQIAHEIKNPLTPMKLSIQHLLKSWEEQAPDWDMRVKRFTETMIGQIESLSAIATDFSDFARIPVPQNEKLDLNELIRDIIILYREIPAAGIIFSPGNEKAWVFADRRQLIRVFTNLINNAIQAIGQDKPGEIKIRVRTENRKQVISITDNGSGIPANQGKNIFDPNFTTKTGGMGLGLAIVKNIVTEAGGEITFISEENTGTTFTVILPEFPGK